MNQHHWFTRTVVLVVKIDRLGVFFTDTDPVHYVSPSFFHSHDLWGLSPDLPPQHLIVGPHLGIKPAARAHTTKALNPNSHLKVLQVPGSRTQAFKNKLLSEFRLIKRIKVSKTRCLFFEERVNAFEEHV